MAQKTRREMLEQFAAANPDDAFARYGLAMECAKTGDHAAATEHFRALLAKHADYVVGYFQYGQLLAQLDRKEEAKTVLSDGMAVAQKVGNTHAHDEMEAVLRDLG